MKNIIVCALLSVVTVATAMAKRPKTILNPPCTTTTTSTIQVSAVTLTDTSTVVRVMAKYIPKHWIDISKTTTIEANGAKYALKSASGIIPGVKFFMPESGETSFTLYFEPLPSKTERFDLIEAHTSGVFNIYGLELKNRTAVRDTPDKDLLESRSDFSSAIPKPVLKAGMARIEGRFLDWRADMPKFSLATSTYLEEIEQSNVPIEVDKDGRFVAEIYLPTTGCITIGEPSRRASLTIVASPGQTQRINISTSKLFNPKAACYGGLNKLYSDNPYTNIFTLVEDGDLLVPYITPLYDEKRFQPEIYGMTTAEYGQYWGKRYRETIANIESNEALPALIKQIAKNKVATILISKLDMYYYHLGISWATKYGTTWDKPGNGFQPLELPTIDYYSEIKNMELDTDIAFIFNNLSNIARDLHYILQECQDTGTQKLFSALYHKGQITPEERLTLKAYLDDPRNEALLIKAATVGFAHQEQLTKFRDERKKALMSDLVKQDQSYISDLILQLRAIGQMSEFIPHTMSDLDSIGSLIKHKDMAFFIEEQNRKLIAKLENNKQRTDYTVVDLKDVAPADVLKTIIDKHKGKVIFIDFWATWCGPCRSAMVEAKPAKEALKGKDVVYVYITSSSPENTWKNMIPEIPGEHYFLTREQGKHISTIDFQYSAIPSYAIIGRDGKIKHFQTGFMGARKMQELLEKELNQTTK